MISDDDKEAAEAVELLRQATLRLTQEREPLAELLRQRGSQRAASGDAMGAEPDMASLLDLIDALSLIQRPEQVLQVPPGTRPLRAKLDAMLETAQARYSQQGVALTTHVAPALDTHVLSTSTAIVHLVKLLLDDALHRTGSGTVRLSVQPGHDNFLHIDVVGTRKSPDPAPADASVGVSIPARAAQALAQTIGGRIEKLSMTGQGPWASVIIPMNA